MQFDERSRLYQMIEEAVKNVLASGYRTKDIVTGSSGEKIVGCRAMGEAVLDALN